MAPPSDDPPGFAEWYAAEQRAEYDETCPTCPQCHQIMRFEMKDGRYIHRKQDGYYLRRCWPCNRIWQMVRGEFREWFPQRHPL